MELAKHIALAVCAVFAACGQVSARDSAVDVEASYRCVTCTPQAPAISFAVSLANPGDAAIAISELELRYWVVMTTPSNLVFTCSTADSVFGGCSNVRFTATVISPALPESGVDRVLRLTCGAAAGHLTPGEHTPELSVAIARMAGTPLEQSNDYSFDASKTGAPPRRAGTCLRSTGRARIDHIVSAAFVARATSSFERVSGRMLVGCVGDVSLRAIRRLVG